MVTGQIQRENIDCIDQLETGIGHPRTFVPKWLTRNVFSTAIDSIKGYNYNIEIATTLRPGLHLYLIRHIPTVNLSGILKSGYMLNTALKPLSSKRDLNTCRTRLRRGLVSIHAISTHVAQLLECAEYG